MVATLAPDEATQTLKVVSVEPLEDLQKLAATAADPFASSQGLRATAAELRPAHVAPLHIGGVEALAFAAAAATLVAEAIPPATTETTNLVLHGAAYRRG